MPNTGLRWLIALVVLFLACPGDKKSPMPELVVPEWQDGEISVYHISRNDSVLYRSQVGLRLDEEFGVPTVVVTITVEPVMARHYFSDSSVVVFHRDNLTPLRSFRNIETDIGFFDIEARYDKRKVFVRKRSIDGIEEQQFKLPANSYDNEMVPVFLRSVPLVSGTNFSIKTVVPLDMRIVPVDVMVLGTKNVTSWLGNVMCREVALITPYKEVRFWYELEEPHRLIGLRDPETETEMLLAGYTRARADTLEPTAR